PELLNIHPKDTKEFPQIVQLTSIGNCVIFPVWVWKKYGFLTPEPFPQLGSCYTRLCKMSGLPVLMDMKAKLVRDRTNSSEAYYPLKKRFRGTMGYCKDKVRSMLQQRMKLILLPMPLQLASETWTLWISPRFRRFRLNNCANSIPHDSFVSRSVSIEIKAPTVH